MRRGLLLLVCAARLGAEASGTVRDPSGAAVEGARVTLVTPQGGAMGETRTDSGGEFRLPPTAAGSYQLRVEAAGFAPAARAVRLPARGPLRIVLAVAPARGEVSVTAARGYAEAPRESAHVVSVHDLERGSAPLATVAHGIENAPGVLLQQTASAQASPFLRGLTGYQVLNLVDGVRFNNATFRSGPNQYLAFIEPTQAQRVETVLGPAGAQYGSDALGGAIHVLTREARFRAGGGWAPQAELGVTASSADASAGVHANVSLASPRVFWLVGGSGRRHNDIRAGDGVDSHHVFRRLLGLRLEDVRGLVGARQQDTAFTQTGGYTKLALRPSALESATVWYQRSAQDGVRGYKDLWGGLGRMESSFAPQELDFGYLRWEKLALGPLDSVSGTVSYNAQGDGSRRQGLRETDTVTTDFNRVAAWGYAGQGTLHAGRRHAVVFGGELYRERVGSTRVNLSPASGVLTAGRALYPDGARYATHAFFAQSGSEWLAGRLRATGGARHTGIRFRTDADARFGVPAARQRFRDFTWHGSVSWRAREWLTVHGLSGRGFRAPNLNDLGALGLNDLGYEIPAADAIGAGALAATSAGENALSTGRPLTALGAERLLNYEAGLRLHGGRLDARLQWFDAELYDPIVRRTLLFAASSAPSSLSGLAVTPVAQTAAQREQGVTAVATALDPRAVKAFVNDGRARYYGTEALLEYRVAAHWRVEAGYAFLTGRELNPNRNIRRLPPQQGHLTLRYIPAGRRLWVTASAGFAGAQRRLSGGDIDDERIGASRRRQDIADFLGGGRVRGFLSADGRFAPTGETLRQIQDRVLPLGAVIHGVAVAGDGTRVPMLAATHGWAVVNVEGGYPVGERHDVLFGVRNVGDRNYRLHGSGIDAPGRNIFVGLRLRF